MVLVSLCVSLLIIIFLATCEGLETPKLTPAVYVAAEGSDRVINFTCTYNADSAMATEILVNDSQASQSVQAERGIQSEVIDGGTRVLSIKPLAINNNTQLKCQVVRSELSMVYSKTSYLWIQGTLAPPKDLKTGTPSTGQPNILRLVWTAPFTLNLTEVDPDISGYQVCFIFAEELELSDSNCMMTRNDYYDFPFVDLPLIINVSAINIGEVGEAGSFRLVFSNATSGAGAVVGSNKIDVKVAINPLSSLYSIMVEIQQPIELERYAAYKLAVYCAENSSATVLASKLLMPSIPDQVKAAPVQKLIVMLAEVTLPDNSPLILHITAVDSHGEQPFDEGILFTTYDIQSLTLTSLPDGLNLRCAFMKGSTARSCDLILCNNEDITCKHSKLPRNMPSAFLETTLCWYVARVTEVENDEARTIVPTKYLQVESH